MKKLNDSARKAVEPPEAKPGQRVALVAMSQMTWYEIVDSTVQNGKEFKKVANGKKHTIEPGTIFNSTAQLMARGVDQVSIDSWIENGHLQYRTFESLVRGLPFDGVSRMRTPPVLSNTTGSGEEDKALGMERGAPALNTPGVKWGWNPDHLSSRSLDWLNDLIAQTDPTVDAAVSVESAIDMLTQDWDG